MFYRLLQTFTILNVSVWLNFSLHVHTRTHTYNVFVLVVISLAKSATISSEWVTWFVLMCKKDHTRTSNVNRIERAKKKEKKILDAMAYTWSKWQDGGDRFQPRVNENADCLGCDARKKTHTHTKKKREGDRMDERTNRIGSFSVQNDICNLYLNVWVCVKFALSKLYFLWVKNYFIWCVEIFMMLKWDRKHIFAFESHKQ